MRGVSICPGTDGIRATQEQLPRTRKLCAGKDHGLTRGDLPAYNGRGGTEPAKVRVNMAEGRYIAPAISAFTPSMAISAEDENLGHADRRVVGKGPKAV